MRVALQILGAIFEALMDPTLRFGRLLWWMAVTLLWLFIDAVAPLPKPSVPFVTGGLAVWLSTEIVLGFVAVGRGKSFWL